MRALITIFIISLGSIKISTCPEPPRMNINFQYDGSIKDVMPIIKGYLEEKKYDIIHYAPDPRFILTDYKKELIVVYNGAVPNLFSEERGAVVEGKLNDKSYLIADRILAKHDENYMPPEMKKIFENAK